MVSRPIRRGRGFWGDIERYVVPSAYSDNQYAYVAADMETVKQPLSKSVIAEAIATPVMAIPPSPQPVIDDDLPSTVLSEESAALAEDIRQIKYKYIVGKIAGQDLSGHDGRILVRKNEVISEEHIELADREGKLADLIVSMRIPGLGEE
ncbi:hypothetical protein [Cohnella candidum]|uniref:Uncharacterized protein n=1 Tax=Cohnella candidum TaxID=2674991 RepID=A0A3G3JT65_9BACL|nr:hypothetical protein [Cohnella candidum]AYQ71384.1 hypothetical protein EAV92_01540 [Cohnella candidum]